MPNYRARWTSVALGIGLTMTLAGCSGGSTGSAAGTESPSQSSAVTPSPTQVSAPAPTYTLAYADGRVSGAKGRLKVALGAKVTIRVTSDVADEVHLHGYDVSVDVAAGGSALIAFTARIPVSSRSSWRSTAQSSPSSRCSEVDGAGARCRDPG